MQFQELKPKMALIHACQPWRKLRIATASRKQKTSERQGARQLAQKPVVVRCGHRLGGGPARPEGPLRAGSPKLSMLSSCLPLNRPPAAGPPRLKDAVQCGPARVVPRSAL